MHIDISPAAERIMLLLRAAGFEAYIVGGCVRDSLLEREPNDWDITTNALPHQVKQALLGLTVVDTGIVHGTVTAIVDGQPIEVTTYRVDGTYADGRHPDQVAFTGDLLQDLQRRDFTINAMAYSPEEGIIDPYGGIQDLEAGLLRTVGDPDARFTEDALRIMRAMRFSATLGFHIDPETAAAMRRCRDRLELVAQERLQNELSLLLCGSNVKQVLLEYVDILGVVLPEIVPEVGFDQHTQYHIYDVWEHTAHSVPEVDPQPALRLAMLLHDAGKPLTFTLDAGGVGHFYGHGDKSTELARAALTRLRYSRQIIETVCLLIKYHDSDILPSEKSLRRWLRRLGPEQLELLLQVKRADNRAQNPLHDGRQREILIIRRNLARIRQQDAAYSLAQLAVNGEDLLQAGISGRQVGETLDRLLEEVIEGVCENRRPTLLKRIREYQS